MRSARIFVSLATVVLVATALGSRSVASGAFGNKQLVQQGPTLKKVYNNRGPASRATVNFDYFHNVDGARFSPGTGNDPALPQDLKCGNPPADRGFGPQAISHGPGVKGSMVSSAWDCYSTVIRDAQGNEKGYTSEATPIAVGFPGNQPGWSYSCRTEVRDPWAFRPIDWDESEFIDSYSFDIFIELDLTTLNSVAGLGVNGWSGSIEHHATYTDNTGTYDLFKWEASGDALGYRSVVSGVIYPGYDLFLTHPDDYRMGVDPDIMRARGTPVTISQLDSMIAADFLSDGDLDNPLYIGMYFANRTLPTETLPDGSYWSFGYDNAAQTAAPEPASVIVLVAGVVLAARLRRR